jgi:cytochrome c2
VLAIYNRNIFPDMKVTGASIRSISATPISPVASAATTEATTAAGQSITQDCNACHNLLAMDEANPKVLTDLGITEAKATK